MAKQRIVNTRFWDDSYIARLSPNEKLLFLYLLTSPLTTIAGVYELPVKRAAFDTGLPAKEIGSFFSRLEAQGKIARHQDWIGIVNFIKHQSLNPKVKQGIVCELKRAPKELTEKLPMEYQGLGITFDGLSHPNPNLNFNSNPNPKDAFSEAPSPSYPQDVQHGIRQLVRKMRLSP